MAQQTSGSAVPPDREQIENYVRIVNVELERAQARVESLTSQMVALDDDMESRLGRIVSLLSSVRDSTDNSSVRIRKEKEEALKGLKTIVTYYAQERDRRKKEMGNRYSAVDSDDLARDVAALNARIEARVTQSLDIASSLTQYQEGSIDRYQDSDTDYSNKSREQRKMERDVNSSAKIKSDLVAGLQASIEKLTRDVKAREAELSRATDPAAKERLTQDIQTMKETIDERRAQIEDVVVAPRPASRPVSSKGAFELSKMIDEMKADLRTDFTKFKSLIYERDMARVRVKDLKMRLEKATAQLDQLKSPPPAK